MDYEKMATRVRELECVVADLTLECRDERARGDLAVLAHKDFHKSLCERFGYAFDDIDWRRDQMSLTEFIAKEKVFQPKWAEKVGGSYQAKGHVVAEFKTLGGEMRYVFEFKEPKGMLHIFNSSQIEIDETPF